MQSELRAHLHTIIIIGSKLLPDINTLYDQTTDWVSLQKDIKSPL